MPTQSSTLIALQPAASKSNCRTSFQANGLVFAIQVQEKVKSGLVPLNKYVITKQLTKRPEDYPDAKNQAHVQVAIRRRAAGKRDGVMQASSYICNITVMCPSLQHVTHVLRLGSCDMSVLFLYGSPNMGPKFFWGM